MQSSVMSFSDTRLMEIFVQFHVNEHHATVQKCHSIKIKHAFHWGGGVILQISDCIIAFVGFLFLQRLIILCS